MGLKWNKHPKKTLLEKKGYDPFLLARLQPAGNLKLEDERYIKTGDGYCSCIHVYEYPAENGEFWLSNLTSETGVYTVIDVGTQPDEETTAHLNRSLAELEGRMGENASHSDRREDEHRYTLLDDLLTSVKTQGETVKLVHCRLYVPGRTREEVDKKVKEIIQRLESMEYRAAVFLNETDCEYRALFSPASRQSADRNRRTGTPMPSLTLAGGYPFNTEQLLDPFGSYIASTETGGNVIFDQFHKTARRLSYDALAIGRKGSGKSTLLKMLVQNSLVTGSYIRVLDCTGEFTELARHFGGTVIAMDGSSGMLNIMEIFKSGDSEAISFSRHLSKLNTFYKFISPEAGEDERNEFEEYCRRLYEQRGFRTGTPVTGRNPREYPRLSELLSLIRSDLYEDQTAGTIRETLSAGRIRRLENMELAIGNLVNSYGEMFDGATSIPDLKNRKFIVYNVENLSSMKDEIFQAQLFSLLSLMLDDMYGIGSLSRMLAENGRPVEDVSKLLLVIDEAHRFINTRNPLALNFITTILREARKYFTGLVFASQSIRDYAPESSDTAGMDALKTLFELVQYKFIMQQDSNSLDHLEKVFAGELTEIQLRGIPRFGVGEGILLTGEESLHIYLEPTQEELELFKGGR